MMHYVQRSQHKNAEKKLKKKHNQRAEKHPNKVKIVSCNKNNTQRRIELIGCIWS